MLNSMMLITDYILKFHKKANSDIQ